MPVGWMERVHLEVARRLWVGLGTWLAWSPDCLPVSSPLCTLSLPQPCSLFLTVTHLWL